MTQFTQSDAFNRMLQERIDPLREELTVERAKWEKRAKTAMHAAIIVAGTLIAVTILQWFTGGVFENLIFFSGMAVFASFTIRRVVLNYGLTTFKDMIVPHVLDHFGTFTYKAKPPRGTFRSIATNHLLPSYNRSTNEDHISGDYRDLPFEMIEAHLKYKSSGKNSSTRTVFKGLIMRIENPKVLKGSYALFPNFKRLGGMFGYPNGWERIKLESGRFEERFDLVGTDQIEGRVLFTPKQMEQWLDFSTKNQARTITAIFDHGSLYMAISRKGDWMDDSLINADDDTIDSQVLALAEDLESVFAALDILVFDVQQERS